MGEVQVNKGQGREPRRQFDEVFKRDAVRIVETGNSSVRKVAKNLVSRGLVVDQSPSRQGLIATRERAMISSRETLWFMNSMPCG